MSGFVELLGLLFLYKTLKLFETKVKLLQLQLTIAIPSGSFGCWFFLQRRDFSRYFYDKITKFPKYSHFGLILAVSQQSNVHALAVIHNFEPCTTCKNKGVLSLSPCSIQKKKQVKDLIFLNHLQISLPCFSIDIGSL